MAWRMPRAICGSVAVLVSIRIRAEQYSNDIMRIANIFSIPFWLRNITGTTVHHHPALLVVSDRAERSQIEPITTGSLWDFCAIKHAQISSRVSSG